MSAAVRLAPDAAPTPSPAAEGITSFRDLLLPQPLRQAVSDLGFTTPTAIQAAAIPALLAGRDVTGIAQTGTGKTAAFGLPLLSAIDPTLAAVQAIVLAPTRELAIQVSDAISTFARHMSQVKIATIYGGSPYGKQLSALKSGAQIVVGTPGRVIDHLTRGSLRLDQVSFVVLDEADEMLQMGFAEDVDRILADAPRQRQTALFSATMPRAIRGVAKRHLLNPMDVSVAASTAPAPDIDQFYAVTPFRHKPLALQRILAMSAADAAIVFVRTRQGCEELGATLQHAGFRVAVISGDVPQQERERTIDRLRDGTIDVLVATDVAARGLDVERIGLVVNYDPPQDAHIYTHRIGRTGRAGRDGQSVLLLTPKEVGKQKKLSGSTATEISQMPIPTAEVVMQVQAHAALAGAMAYLERNDVDAMRQAILAAADDAAVSAIDVAAALLATAVGANGAAKTDPFSPAELAKQHSGKKRNRTSAARDFSPRRFGESGSGKPRTSSSRRRPTDQESSHRRSANRSSRYSRDGQPERGRWGDPIAESDRPGGRKSVSYQASSHKKRGPKGKNSGSWQPTSEGSRRPHGQQSRRKSSQHAAASGSGGKSRGYRRTR